MSSSCKINSSTVIQHCDHAKRMHMLHIDSRLVCRHVTSPLRLTPRLLGQPSEWNCDRKVFQLFGSTVATRGCGSVSGGFTGWWDCWSEILGIHVLTGIGHIYDGPTCNPLATDLSLICEPMSREHWWNASDRGETKLLGERTCTTVTLSTTSPTRIRPNAAKTGMGDNRRPIYLSRTQLYSVANWITNGCAWLAVCRSFVNSFKLNSCIKLTHAPRIQSAFNSKPNRCELQNLVRGWQLSESHFIQPALLNSPPHAPPNSNRHTANAVTSPFFLPQPLLL
jgi:hypothetical protein